MNEDERSIWRKERNNLKAEILLSQEALRVARRIFPNDKVLSQIPIHEGFNFKSAATYNRIVRYLRRYPDSLQRQFFSDVWGPDGVGVPSSEELAAYLTKCNSIPWFAPRKVVDKDILYELVREHLLRSKAEELPVLLIQDDWSAAVNLEIERGVEDEPWVQVAKAIDRAVEESSRRDIAEGIGSAVWNSSWIVASRKHVLTDVNNQGMVDKLTLQLFINDGVTIEHGEKEWAGAYFGAWTASNQVTAGAKFYIVADTIVEHGFTQNPFEPLIDIYRLGYKPIGILVEEHDGEKMQAFGVFQPPLVND